MQDVYQPVAGSGNALAEGAALIRGSGEMASLIRAHAWHATELGPIAQWPPELLTLVNMMLASRDIGTVFWGPDRIMIYNDAYTTQLGERHPVLGRTLHEVWPEVADQVAPLIDTVRHEGKSTYLDDSPLTVLEDGVANERFYTASFEPIWVIGSGTGQIQGVYQTGINNTAKVLAQRRLQASESEAHQAQLQVESTANRLALALDAADLASWYYDPDLQIVGGDRKMAELFGIPAAIGPAELWIGRIHPDDRERVAAEFAAALAGAPYDTTYRVVLPDKTRWVKAKARQIQEEGRKRLVGLCEDVTLPRQTEAALRSTAERLHLAQTTAHVASWDWDLETNILVWNGSELTWGLPPEQMDTPEKCFARIHPDDAEAVREALGPAMHSRANYACEFRVLWPDNSWHWITASGQSVSFRQDGTSTRLVGINIDSTSRKLAEAALLQNEKLAAVGRLASSIAHEINNPLESITNLLYLVAHSDDLASVREYTSIAEQELRRVSLIATQTLRFHKQSTKAAPAYCYDLIGDTLALYQGRIANNRITVEKKKRAEHPVECLGGEIRQVLSNLIVNAIDAMPLGGRLVLRSREATNWKTGQRGLVLTVADTGTGMSAETQKKLFDAFYTTKGIGGTGLGLWISCEIVGRHGGSLRVRSSQDPKHRGTVFTLFLPFGVSAPAPSSI